MVGSVEFSEGFVNSGIVDSRRAVANNLCALVSILSELPTTPPSASHTFITEFADMGLCKRVTSTLDTHMKGASEAHLRCILD